MPEFKTLKYHVSDSRVATITLARPGKRNAQDTHLLYELNDAFLAASRDSNVKVIILAAEGADFSAGHDLGEVDWQENWANSDRTTGWELTDGKGVEQMLIREKEIYLGFCQQWRRLPKPTIAQVQGRCIAGGLMLVWPCDLIIAADNAKFRDNTLTLGVSGVEYFAHPWEVGPRKAKEMLFTADWLGAEEAHQRGMVNHVVPLDELEDFTRTFAARIASRPMTALRAAKMAVNAAEDAQGRGAAEETAFAYHHLTHAHNREVYGMELDPTAMEAATISTSKLAPNKREK
ncbi:MAG: enoyl-CoA hydratase [Robiginitomaculum sp.]|nr:MAG: enoyl-CoA hydratase [Robiginitomaculum sp.]